MIRVAGLNDFINAGNSFISQGENGAITLNKDLSSGLDVTNPVSFAEQFVDIGQILIAIGIVTLLIVSAIMAIKWITATPDKQAKLKTQLIGLVVSAVVIFGAIGIWNLVWGILANIETNLK